MKIRMDQLIQSIGSALDIVENEVFGAPTNHGKRLALMSILMCKQLGMSKDESETIAYGAFLHDNALTEFQAATRGTSNRKKHFENHCIDGQINFEMLPLKSDPTGLVMYHHENANGTGLFKLTEAQIPLGAQLIACADHIDVSHRLQHESPDLDYIRKKILSRKGTRYTTIAADAMHTIMSHETLAMLRDENIKEALAEHLPAWHIDVNSKAMYNLATLSARIIDFHSDFTKRHSSGIANKAWVMSGYYNFDQEKRAKIYLAAALHDIGKLVIPNEILDKPGKLTDDEFETIKSHVYHSFLILDGIDGFEEIRNWASDHHEKLDGTGYHFGKNADDLDFISRMMAVTDIYQAVIEERPYHEARTHEETMPILRHMAEKGFVDAQIVADFDHVMAGYEFGHVPTPTIDEFL